MKATKVTYSRTVNLGNFNSVKIEIEVAIDEGESFDSALDYAQNTVERASALRAGMSLNDELKWAPEVPDTPF